MIRNPILPGFNPDPSILRVGDDYYVATSTFEWWPGVQIHHSRDLVHWRLLTRPLDRLDLLDLRGCDHSGGIWAPCLTHARGRFWLLFTNVRNWKHRAFDTPNYLTSAPAITGPWSAPVYLNSSGFDPSLFHDHDGRSYVVNMRWDFRPERNQFNGILCQEIDLERGVLLGEAEAIFAGSRLGVTEGPHVYRHRDWYYLMTAEGGTGWNHAVTMARSRSLRGPYEIDPQNPMLTSRGAWDLPLQKAGHASLVETQGGDWYLAHLCSRPVMPQRRCVLGRETGLQRVRWDGDGWLRLAQGGNRPALEVAAPALPPHPWPEEPGEIRFAPGALPAPFQTLRDPPAEDWLSLAERPGCLRLRGRESLWSRFQTSLVARRVQHARCAVETCVECAPASYQQMAGLVAYYDLNWYYLHLTAGDDGRRELALGWSDNGAYGEWTDCRIGVPAGPIHLGFDLDGASLQARWSTDGRNWTRLGPANDLTRLSDDYQGLHFTGAFVGMACQDLSGRRMPADFSRFAYLPQG